MNKSERCEVKSERYVNGFIKKNLSLRTSHFSLQQGQSLIESICALAIISIIVTAIAVTIATSLSNAKFNQDETLATKYAQQGSEVVRKIRNSSYTNFKSFNGLYCFGKDQSSLGIAQSSCSTPNVDTFIRSVQVEQTPGCTTNVARVTVQVAFTDGKCANNVYCHVITNTSCLSTVNPVVAP